MPLKIVESVSGVVLALGVALFISWAVSQGAPPYVPRPVNPLAECHTQSGLPTNVVVCQNGHAYELDGGNWLDMGRVTPVPPVPQADAIIPDPSSKPQYCSSGNRMFRCWCDEWIHYPICRRWHWHPYNEDGLARAYA